MKKLESNSLIYAVLGAVLMLAAVLPAAAAARRTAHPAFTVLGSEPAMTDGNFTFVPATDNAGGTLITERTGTVSEVTPPPGCGSYSDQRVYGGGHLLEQCQSSLELYTVNTGAWTPIQLSPLISSTCAEPGGSCGPAAIGRDWLKWQLNCYHCQTESFYQNLTTGETRRVISPSPSQDKQGTTQTLNLNTPVLMQRLCAPVRNPPGGVVAVEGRTVVTQQRYRLTLQRCGRRTSTLLTKSATAWTADSGLVVWWDPHHPTVLYGRDPESTASRQFVLPAGVQSVQSIAITKYRLYVDVLTAGQQELLGAQLPH